MKTIIPPMIPEGTRDFSPEEMGKREYVFEKIKEVFVNFGYSPIETPALEYAKTLYKEYGNEGSKLMYMLQDHGGKKLALRYDQTVPFARFIAKNFRKLPMPFKRYQISPVWRADKPDRGRYREFYQCDFDVVGTDSLLAEAEIVQVIVTVLKSLGFSSFSIKFNSRRFMHNLFSKFKISEEKQATILRILDKFKKTSLEKTKKDLKKVLAKDKAEALLKLLTMCGSSEEMMQKFKNEIPDEISEFLLTCSYLGVPSRYLTFTPSLVRGFDYYTGIVFEAVLHDFNLGSVCAGGRYDDLCSTFCNEKLSGVGAAFGFERIMIALEERNMLMNAQSNSEVLVANISRETLENSLKILNELRRVGIRSEVYFHSEPLGKQINYAVGKGIPFVILCGPNEVKQNQAIIKVIKTGKEKIIPQSQIPIYLKGYTLL